MRLGGWLAVAAALFALAGCSGGHSRPQHATPARERAWVGSLRRWLTVEAFQGNFRNCAARIARDVGAPPARDLDALQRRVDGLCSHFAAAYRDVDRAFKTKDADLYARSQREMHGAQTSIDAVRGLVDAWHPGSLSGLPTKGGVTEVSRIEPRFSAAASAIAGHRVLIRCWSKDDWAGVVGDARNEGATGIVDLSGLADPTADHADLSPEVCRDLVATSYLGDHTSASAAFGLTVLAHEATHLEGDSGALEDVTECYAMQRVPIAAAKLGVSRRDARRLARFYFREIYPEDLPEYRTAGCRNGGPYDLHPGDPVWP